MSLDMQKFNATLFSNYTVEEMIEIIAREAEKLAKSNEREPSLLKELTNDRNALSVAMELEVTGDPIDPSTGYESFEEWIDHVSKQVRASERSLATIDVNKIIVIALEYFVENAA
ncbi:hypothetical protein [Cetobacterium sp.]|uniref:hypothetical protein n=1 Tax=Cetobacterium sp. TaxID=2071632 RepID=UPI003F331B5E